MAASSIIYIDDRLATASAAVIDRDVRLATASAAVIDLHVRLRTAAAAVIDLDFRLAPAPALIDLNVRLPTAAVIDLIVRLPPAVVIEKIFVSLCCWRCNRSRCLSLFDEYYACIFSLWTFSISVCILWQTEYLILIWKPTCGFHKIQEISLPDGELFFLNLGSAPCRFLSA